MKATYDTRTDTLSIILKDEAQVAQSDEDKPGVILAHGGAAPAISIGALLGKQLRLHGSHYASRVEIEHVLDLVARRQLNPVIHKVGALKDVQNMARLTAERAVFGKMVLVP